MRVDERWRRGGEDDEAFDEEVVEMEESLMMIARLMTPSAKTLTGISAPGPGYRGKPPKRLSIETLSHRLFSVLQAAGFHAQALRSRLQSTRAKALLLSHLEY